MHRFYPFLASFAGALAACVVSLCIHAAPRTFVSTAGNDANACSLAAPCRSFEKAITATDTSGEIIVLDSGGYGRVTIDKSVTIAASSGIYAGISVFAGTNGIDIGTPGIKVALRGLTINGQGGQDGIAVSAVATVDIENCAISHMSRYGVYASTDGVNLSIKDSSVQDNADTGINVVGAIQLGAERLRVERNGGIGINLLNEARGSIADSVIAGNSDSGLQFGNTVNVGTMVLALSGSRIYQNALAGVLVGNTMPGNLKFEGSGNVIADNVAFGVGVSAAGGGTVAATLRGNKVAHNGGVGVLATSEATVNLADSVIVANASFGLQQSSNAVLNTLGNNIVRDNNNGGPQRQGLTTPIAGI